MACYNLRPHFFGAIAQLGERRTGSAKVSGSIPLSSTNKKTPWCLHQGVFLYRHLKRHLNAFLFLLPHFTVSFDFWQHIPMLQGSKANDVLRLRAFLSLSNSELNPLALSQGSEAVTDDSSEMGEYIGPGLLFNETKTFAFIEPFHGARDSGGAVHGFLLSLSYTKLCPEGRGNRLAMGTTKEAVHGDIVGAEVTQESC
jgi:hypothetical protein